MVKVRFIPPEPPDESKRPDRVEKLKKRKSHQETVVKSCLLKYLHGENDQKVQIKKAIQDRIMSYSKRINMASLILLRILKELFHNQDDVLSVQLPNFCDQTFIRQLILGTEDAKKPNQLVRSYQQRHPRLFHDIKRFTTDRNIFTAGAIKYVTNLKNSLWMNFPNRVKKFLKLFQEKEGLNDDERVALLYLIMGWDFTFTNLATVFPLTEKVWNVVTEHKRILGNETIDNKWIKSDDNLHTMFRYNVLLNRYYQANNLPLFNLVPVCTIKSHFITIDSTSLHGVMKDSGLVNCGEKEFLALKEEHWESFLKLRPLQGSQSTFTGTIETDGVALCTHFQRPKPSKQVDKLIKSFEYKKKQQRVIGVDTGRVNIFYGAEITDDEEIKKFILTRNQYYTGIGAFKSRKLVQGWNNGIKDILVALSKVSTKGIDISSHNEYLDTYLQHYDALWAEYTKERWSRNRLSLYGGKQRVWDAFFNEIQSFDKDKEVVIAYGASKFCPTGKGEMAVPTSQVYKETIRRFKEKVYLVDEFRSTKIYYQDDTILQSVKSKKTNRVLRGLLWCRSTINNRSHFVDRDLNAALNIRRCLINRRPAIMTRSTGQRRLPKVIGKIIKR